MKEIRMGWGKDAAKHNLPLQVTLWLTGEDPSPSDISSTLTTGLKKKGYKIIKADVVER